MTGKKIVLGVSGGIAAYKAVELLRLLTKAGAEVYVVMTENAKQFITPLTFEALSGRPVYHKIFDSERSASMEHIRAAEDAELMVVAPATANTLGKMANGLADDPLSTLYAAFAGTVVVAPAMNDQMWANPAVHDNLRKWSGSHLMDPSTVPGVLLSTVPVRTDDPGLTDVTATILDYFGVEVGEGEILGRSLLLAASR